MSAAMQAARGLPAQARATHEQTTALWVAAFFDELVRWGVRDVVVSPGSRSTALAMAAFELNRRRPCDLRLYVDVDERGAAFLGLGMAKASGRPAVLVCTSGTALANYYPAVIEAETSRVPLIVLSGDRPPQLQGLGAPQTTDQLKAYGDHVRAFRAMPLPSATEAGLAFARQAAREACIAALGGAGGFGGFERGDSRAPADEAAAGGCDVQVASRGCARMAGPVQVNFPFDEPLKPDFAGADALVRFAVLKSEGGRDVADGGLAPGSEDAGAAEPGAFSACRPACSLDASVGVHAALDTASLEHLEARLRGRRVMVMAGEGTCSTLDEARRVVAWARERAYPLIADPLSGLRAVDDPAVIDNYDNVFRWPDAPMPDVVIRFGRYPISKPATKAVEAAVRAGSVESIVVDCGETRDFNFATGSFAGLSPLEFASSRWTWAPDDGQRAFAHAWAQLNDAARDRILSVGAKRAGDAADVDVDGFEGAYVRKIFELAPAGSCVFSANSMSVRAVDTFHVKGDGPVCVLCNRGQNGIDGTTSTALGAAQCFEQTTFLTGDFTLLHDLSALALQRELMTHHREVAASDAAANRGAATASAAGEAPGLVARSVVVVLLNNNGGAIFDMLPQASSEDYFERLFLVPQDVRFEHAARAFGVPYRAVSTVEDFAEAYAETLGMPGISLIEVRVPLRGVKERYGRFQG